MAQKGFNPFTVSGGTTARNQIEQASQSSPIAQQVAALKQQGWGDYGMDNGDLDGFNALSMSAAIQQSLDARGRQQRDPVVVAPTPQNPAEAVNQFPVAAVPMNLNQQLNFDMSAMLAAGTLPTRPPEQPVMPPTPQHSVAARPGQIMEFTSDLMSNFAKSIQEQGQSAVNSVSTDIIGQLTGTDVHAPLRRQQEQLAEQRRHLQEQAPLVNKLRAEVQQTQIRALSGNREYQSNMASLQNKEIANQVDQAKDTLRAIQALSPLQRFKQVIGMTAAIEDAQQTFKKRAEAKKAPPKVSTKQGRGMLGVKKSRTDNGGAQELTGAGSVQ